MQLHPRRYPAGVLGGDEVRPPPGLVDEAGDGRADVPPPEEEGHDAAGGVWPQWAKKGAGGGVAGETSVGGHTTNPLPHKTTGRSLVLEKKPVTGGFQYSPRVVPKGRQIRKNAKKHNFSDAKDQERKMLLLDNQGPKGVI